MEFQTALPFRSIPKLLISALLLLSVSSARAEEGVTEKEIRIGMSNAQTGPNAQIGIGTRAGAAVYFNKVNAAGGIGGRKITLVVRDDGYEPTRAVENTRNFIDQEKVFALFEYLGSPISAAIMPMITRAGIPYFSPITGAGFLRDPIHKYIFSLRVSLAEETEMMVERLTQDLRIGKIGVFTQNDALGEAGEAALLRALRKRNMALGGTGTYQRNTLEIGGALESLMKANPEAVVMIAPHLPSAAFLKKARERGFAPKFLAFSSGTDALIQEAGAASEGIIVTQTVPNPADSPLPIVKEFVSDMKAAGGVPDFVGLEGYLGAKVMAEALKKTAPLTREGFLSTLEGLNFDAGGLPVSFGPADHQGLHQVFLTKVVNGKVVSIQNLK